MEFGHLEGVPQPSLGDLRSPWLLTTYPFVLGWSLKFNGCNNFAPCTFPDGAALVALQAKSDKDRSGRMSTCVFFGSRDYRGCFFWIFCSNRQNTVPSRNETDHCVLVHILDDFKISTSRHDQRLWRLWDGFHLVSASPDVCQMLKKHAMSMTNCEEKTLLKTVQTHFVAEHVCCLWRRTGLDGSKFLANQRKWTRGMSVVFGHVFLSHKMGPRADRYKWSYDMGFTFFSPRNKWSYFGPYLRLVFGPTLPVSQAKTMSVNPTGFLAKIHLCHRFWRNPLVTLDPLWGWLIFRTSTCSTTTLFDLMTRSNPLP